MRFATDLIDYYCRPELEGKNKNPVIFIIRRVGVLSKMKFAYWRQQTLRDSEDELHFYGKFGRLRPLVSDRRVMSRVFVSVPGPNFHRYCPALSGARPGGTSRKPRDFCRLLYRNTGGVYNRGHRNICILILDR